MTRRDHYSAVLADGANRVWEVEPGWYHVLGETDDARVGSVTVEVKDGARHEVPFTM